MLQRYQNYPNGMTNNTNGVFEYLGVHLAAMNETLLQSYNDKIRVFPAAPNGVGFQWVASTIRVGIRTAPASRAACASLKLFSSAAMRAYCAHSPPRVITPVACRNR